MYERKIPLDPHCGVGIALEVIISKWKFCILSEINKGISRPKDLIQVIPEITKRVLHPQLKQLEFHDVVNRITYAEVPPRVEYSLTELGKSVLPLLSEINEWGIKFAPELEKIKNSKKQSV